MKPNHKTKNLPSDVITEYVNALSGTYSILFWDGLLEIAESLDTIRNIKATITALNSCDKNEEAYCLILALYDLAAMEIPVAIAELKDHPDIIKLFISEFLLDIEDLMYDYEYEE